MDSSHECGAMAFKEGTRQRTLSMEQWCALSRDGAVPAMTVPLEGNSMRPLIRKRLDPVVIAPVWRDLKVGDVVLFVDERQRYVVHRIWKMKQGLVRTLGDNCRYPEPWFSRDRVLGMAMSYKRNGRTHRLDTRRSRIWGRVWMLTYPARLLAVRTLDLITGRFADQRSDKGEATCDVR